MSKIGYDQWGMDNSRRAGQWYLTFMGLALCMIGGIFVALMARSYLRAKSMHEWPQLPCLILKSDVEEYGIGGTVESEYRLNILYRYDFQGKSFESNRWSLRGSIPKSNPSAVEEMVQMYPVGTRSLCWVNPLQPSQALLKLDSKAPLYSIWFPGVFVIAGVGMIYSAWRKPKIVRESLN
jgi:hypothetical protein